jgi:hypothetical protein
MSVYIFNNNKLWFELIESFEKNFKTTKNINESNIIIFNNFELENRKFLLKNKNFFKKKIYCYFHEPFTSLYKEHLKMIKRISMIKNLNLITYSKKNLEYLQLKFPTKKIYYLPISFYNYPDIEIIKDLNIMTLNRSLLTNFHGNYNLKIISKEDIDKYNILLLTNFGKERDKLFSRLKIFINLHKNEKSNLLETLRIYNLIYFRVIIISQKCIDYQDELQEFIIYEEDNLLLKKSLEILNNYDFYFNKIYGNKTNKIIFEKINNYYINFLDNQNILTS